MREPILMPTLSDTMETGHLIDWLKQPGDAVKKGEAIAEVETDKAVMDIEAFYNGYLDAPLAAADADIPVGAVIGYIVDRPGAEKTTAKQEKQEKQEKQKTDKAPVTKVVTKKAETEVGVKTPPPTVQTSTQASAQTAKAPASVKPMLTDMSSSKHIPASPYARGLARELGIDLARLTAGPDGSIRAVQVVSAALGRTEPSLGDGPDYELHPLSPMQKAIANNMMAAATTPTFHVSAQFPLAPLIALAHEEGYSLTLLLARACALTVEAHPRFNAVFTSQGLAQRQQVDVGIAVDVPNGLVTPVLRDVARRPVEELSRNWNALKERATGKQHSQRLTPQDYRGATFYLSNLGMFSSVVHFDAVVPAGAAAILAVAAIQDGLVEFTLSCDHRVVYGADAARFMETLALLLGDPTGLDAAPTSGAA
ncbi:Dihydrolipoamide acetyltransferase component of pyruvate dehydrogenase complex [hydrothermal vent metagenome]|uniref:Dihydrolipoamide acetyltransferase component of pyruvate dehydrogenase complex n=1 Tax=hydrothermal vent metagenome TaxID=652676 RepID=A0A3B1AXW5_9ZZZZ